MEDRKRKRKTRLCLCPDCSRCGHLSAAGQLVKGLMINEDAYREHNAPHTVPPGQHPLLVRARAATFDSGLRATPSATSSFITSIQNALNMCKTTQLSFVQAGHHNAPAFTYNRDSLGATGPDFFQLQDNADARRFSACESALNELGPHAEDAEEISALEDAWELLEAHKRTEWDRTHLNPDQGVLVNSDRHYQALVSRPLPIRVIGLSVLLGWFYHNTPEDTSRRWLKTFRAVFHSTGKTYDVPQICALATEVPLDPNTIVHDYHLDPEIELFVTCPACSSLYPLPENPEKPIPLNCMSKREDPSAPCNAALFRNEARREPFLKYLHHPLAAWLSKMLSRPDIEDVLEDYKSHAPQAGQHRDVEDIWDSKLWWEFANGFMNDNGPDDNVLKLLFGFGMDGFNPFHNLTAKQIRSSTAMYLVLFNLPPHLRYRPENIYLVGVIPGKPSTHLINSYLELVCKDFLEAWNLGHRFTKTSRRPLGRSVKSAILIVICDMLAARQVVGFASHSANLFCTSCALELSRISSIKPNEWPLRNWEAIKQQAEDWLHAPSAKARLRLFKQHHIRWSAFNDLPYWNAVEATVIEVMHANLLNNIPDHVRHIWGIDVEVEDGGDGSTARLGKKRAPNEELDPVLDALNKAISEQDVLMTLSESRCTVRVLATICVDNQLPYGGKKKDLVIRISELLAETPGLVLRRERTQDEEVVEGAEVFELAEDQSQADSTTSQSSSESESDTSEGTSDPNVTPKARRSKLPETEEEAIARKLKKAKEDAKTLKRWHEGTAPVTSILKLGNHAMKKLVEDYAIELPPGAVPKNDVLGQALYDYMIKLWAGEAPHVLGGRLMEIVHQNERDSDYPLGVAKPPSSWGTASHGKLSAAQWGVVGMVSLSITLIHEWGYSDQLVEVEHPDLLARAQYLRDRRLAMLYNFIDLVKASFMAHNRISSDAHSESYDFYIQRYFAMVGRLYPGFGMKPSGHVSLGHVGPFLRKIGPSHAYKADAFERMNYVMQSTETNKKLGQMEATYLMHHCARAALAGHLSSLPILAKEAEGHMRKTAEDIVEAADIILADHHKEQMRNSLGLHNASENVVRLEGLCGKCTPLGEINRPGFCVEDIGLSLTPPVHVVNPAGTFDWTKIIVNGQEYNASAHQGRQHHGCYALVRVVTGDQRAAIIHRLLQIQPTGGGPSQTTVVCRLFPNMNPGLGLTDMYRTLDLGFLVEHEPVGEYTFLTPDRVLCALVLTPIKLRKHPKSHSLLVAYPYDRHRRPFSQNDDFPPIPPPALKSKRKQEEPHAGPSTKRRSIPDENSTSESDSQPVLKEYPQRKTKALPSRRRKLKEKGKVAQARSSQSSSAESESH